jgi:hypothetical protein
MDLKRFADDDGIVCLPPLNREQPAAARLRQVLTRRARQLRRTAR